MDETTRWMLIRWGLSIVLVGIGIYDVYRHRVPNVIVIPLLVASVSLVSSRLITGVLPAGQAMLVAATWIACLIFWGVHACGGGDAKLVMALVGLFPNLGFLVILVGVLLIGHIALLLIRDGRAGLDRLSALTLSTLRGTVPTRADIGGAYQMRRTPITFLISLAGLAYLWLGT